MINGNGGFVVGKALFILLGAAALAGCDAETASNQLDTVMPSAETRNAATEAAPLPREQALALMHDRHEHMEAFGDETKKVGNALKSSNPDVAAIRQSAAKIAELAPKLDSWFPQGTGPDVGKTRAKAEIWQKRDDFASKASHFEQAAQQFDEAARGGDLTQIKAAFAGVGKSCKACHDLYRAPKKD
jgi:cytochrome c556